MLSILIYKTIISPRITIREYKNTKFSLFCKTRQKIFPFRPRFLQPATAPIGLAPPAIPLTNPMPSASPKRHFPSRIRSRQPRRKSKSLPCFNAITLAAKANTCPVSMLSPPLKKLFLSRIRRHRSPVDGNHPHSSRRPPSPSARAIPKILPGHSPAKIYLTFKC